MATEEKTPEIAETNTTAQDTAQTTQVKKRRFPIWGIILIAVGAVLLIGVVSFAAGTQFKKLSNSIRGIGNTPTMNNGRFGRRSSRGMNGTFGQVTAVSDTSITVATRQRFNSSTNSNTSTTKTYTINSSTKVYVDGTTANASSIKTGDRVVIQPSSSDATVAGTIRDGFGGPAAPNNPSGGQQSSDSAQPIVTQ